MHIVNRESETAGACRFAHLHMQCNLSVQAVCMEAHLWTECISLQYTAIQCKTRKPLCNARIPAHREVGHLPNFLVFFPCRLGQYKLPPKRIRFRDAAVLLEYPAQRERKKERIHTLPDYRFILFVLSPCRSAHGRFVRMVNFSIRIFNFLHSKRDKRQANVNLSGLTTKP